MAAYLKRTESLRSTPRPWISLKFKAVGRQSISRWLKLLLHNMTGLDLTIFTGHST